MQKLLLFLKDNMATIVVGLLVMLAGGLIVSIVKKLIKLFQQFTA